ncbi:MAG TPA: MFS transporter [Candidatus Avacidaminococcus intestinavium]|uniref:MFS transporter n=1 Tax=Candidatus Avacidaminococcus intestinavium TaxID=2840684 RepID=A0A9D1MQS2_9FIRM|nr:MFS transporter [Candidatus Avacidaminococcus intestinavium]
MNNVGKSTVAVTARYEEPTKKRVALVIILLFTVLVAYLDRVNVSVLIADPAFLEAMGINGKPFEMGLLTSFFVASYGIANFILTPFGDKLGARKTMILALLLWAISSVIGGLAQSFGIMLASRILLGLGEGLHFPMQSKFVKNWFPPHERGRANATWIVGIMAGPAIAMPFFTTIIDTFGWRDSFFALAAIGLIPVYLLWAHTADKPADHKGVNQAELLYIEEALAKEAAEEQQKDVEEKPSLSQTLKMLAGNYKFILITLYYTCLGSILWGAMAWLPSYLKMARGFSWSSMGIWASMPYVFGIICIMASGYLGDKYNRRALLCAISMFSAAVGIYLGAQAVDNVAAAMWLTFGVGAIGFGISPAWTIQQRIIPSHSVGTAGGIMNGITNIYSALIPAIIGWLIAFTGTYNAGLMVLVANGLFATVCAIPLVLKKY